MIMEFDAHSHEETDVMDILAMSQEELHEFLQREEIENPLFDYSMADVSYPERIRQISPHVDKSFSGTDFILSQIPGGRLTSQESRAARYCVDLLDDRGFLTASSEDIAKDLGLAAGVVEHVLEILKSLEPKGLFAADLTECLELQVAGMEQEDLLKRLIREHLPHIAQGKIGDITRDLKISSMETRKLIAVIRDLNPRPLNGYTQNQAEYLVPDIEIRREDGQWLVELNDGWSGRIGVNDFYVKMLREAQDEELKTYFQEKLRRAEFVVEAVEKRRGILIKISSYIAERQDGYFCRREPLKPMSIGEAGQSLSLSPFILSRTIENKYLSSPRGTVAFMKLFSC